MDISHNFFSDLFGVNPSLGMGCWTVGGHGWGKVDLDDAVRALQVAAEGGISIFDTADCYGLGHSEWLLSHALGSRLRDNVVCSKYGVRWDESGRVWNDSTPNYLITALENSLRRLRLERIPLYYLHKYDGTTPFSEILATLERQRHLGKIGAIGFSNLQLCQLKQCVESRIIDAYQERINISEPVSNNAEFCQESGVPLVAWGALADGLLTGKFTPDTRFPSDDHRSRSPAFIEPRFSRNLKFVDELMQIARQAGATAAQLALAWVRHCGCAVTLFGARNAQQVQSNLSVADIELDDVVLRKISQLHSRWIKPV